MPRHLSSSSDGDHSSDVDYHPPREPKKKRYARRTIIRPIRTLRPTSPRIQLTKEMLKELTDSSDGNEEENIELQSPRRKDIRSRSRDSRSKSKSESRSSRRSTDDVEKKRLASHTRRLSESKLPNQNESFDNDDSYGMSGWLASKKIEAEKKRDALKEKNGD